MRVILLKDVKGTGKKGAVVEVSDGHGRNFLIPRKLAKSATDSNVREQSHIKATEDKKKAEELQEAKELAKKLSALTVTLKSKSGDGGRLFGSITSKDIAEAINKQHKIKVDKRKLVLDGAIKELGDRQVDIKVYPNVVGTIKVSIVSE